MKLPRDFNAQIASAANALPRDLLAGLLTALAPARPAATRPATRPELTKPITRPATPTPPTPPTPKRTRRKRSAYSGAYNVLNRYAADKCRSGTWRWIMISCAIASTTVEQAQQQADKIIHPNKPIDWNWLIKNDIISFTNKGAD